MNPLPKITAPVIHPIRTAGRLGSHAFSLAAAGRRTTLRIIDWAAGQDRVDIPAVRTTGEPIATGTPDEVPPPATEGARQAPSAKEATAGPALNAHAGPTTESPQEPPEPIGGSWSGADDAPDSETEPLLDPATARSVRSESEILRRGAETDKR